MPDPLRVIVAPIGSDGKPSAPFGSKTALFHHGFVDGPRVGHTVQAAATGGTGGGKTAGMELVAIDSMLSNGPGDDRRTILAGPTDADVKRNLLGPILEHFPRHPKDNGGNPLNRIAAGTISPLIKSVDKDQNTLWLHDSIGGGTVTWWR